MANFSTFTDDFNDNSFNTSLWTRDSATYVVETNNQLELSTRTTAAYYGCYSATTYDLDSVSVELVSAGNQSIESYEAYPIEVTKDASNWYKIFVIGGTIYFRKRVGGSNSTQTEAYSSTNHRWLRIRISGDNVLFEKSADGMSWSSAYTTTKGFTATGVELSFSVGTWQNEASTTTMIVDNLNVSPGNAERDFEIHGIVSDNAERSFEIHGVASDNSERGFEVDGASSLTTSERSFDVHGAVSDNTERDFEVTGAVGETSERDIEIHGIASETSERDFEIIGDLTIPYSDDFDDNTLDTNKWTESTNAGSLVEESDGRIKMISNSSISAYVRSSSAFSPQNTILKAKVLNHSTDGGFKLCPTDPSGHQWDVYSESNWYNFQLVSGPKLSVVRKAAGSVSTRATMASNLSGPPYWMRIRIDETTVYFDYADQSAEPAEGEWTTLHSETWGIGTGITQENYTYFTSYNTPTTGAAHFDDFSWSINTPSTTSERDFEAHGIASNNSARDFEIHGAVSDNSERDFEVHGIANNTSERDFEVTGNVLVDSERDFEVDGVDNTATERSIEIHGESNETSEKDFEVYGVTGDNSERSFEIGGISSTTSERGFEVHGIDSEDNNSERDFEVHGIDSDNAERAFEIDANIGDNSERDIEIHGIDNETSERSFEAQGVASTNSERGFEIHGIVSETLERVFEVHGVVSTTSERDFEIEGISSSLTGVKTINGTVVSSVKTINGTTIANIKEING